jgi:hypothetical protein
MKRMMSGAYETMGFSIVLSSVFLRCGYESENIRLRLQYLFGAFPRLRRKNQFVTVECICPGAPGGTGLAVVNRAP